MKDSIGTVYWVTGLSGAGKTTLGTLLHQTLQQQRTAVLLDGDALRQIYGDDIGYDPADRQRMAMRNAKLCKFLAQQGIDVVCCTIGMFDAVRDWNREEIERYCEIYLRVKPEVLCQRDQKGLYSGVRNGKLKNVMGMDLEFEEPKHPDLIIENNGDETPEQVLTRILQAIPH